MFRQYQFYRFDWLLLLTVIGISILGIIVIGSATDSTVYENKQIIGLITGTIIMIVVAFIDYKFIGKCYWLLYVLNIVMLILVLILGQPVNGATRWFKLPGGFTIQPSELSKIIMTIFIATFLDKNKEKINNPLILLQLLILFAIPTSLIERQPDLSTSLVFVFLLAILLFVAGISYKYIISAFAIVVPSLVGIVWYVQQPFQKLLEPYQVDRIKSLLNPEAYLMTEFYQQYNSILAIGSGQLYGKGLNNGTVTSVKNANFLSEPQTDFIFSVVGEELGFIRSSLIILLIFFLIIKCLLIAKDAKDTLGMLIITGIVSIISFQTFVNIGVATAILPNTGLPLPFISYGLSSLWSNMIGIGLILNISMQRKGIIKRG